MDINENKVCYLTFPNDPCPRTLSSSNCAGSAFSHPSFTWCVIGISFTLPSSYYFKANKNTTMNRPELSNSLEMHVNACSFLVCFFLFCFLFLNKIFEILIRHKRKLFKWSFPIHSLNKCFKKIVNWSKILKECSFPFVINITTTAKTDFLTWRE